MQAAARKNAVTATAAVTAAALSPMTMVAITLLVGEVAVIATMVRRVTTTDAEPMGAVQTMAAVSALTTSVVSVEAMGGVMTAVTLAEAVVTTMVAQMIAALQTMILEGA